MTAKKTVAPRGPALQQREQQQQQASLRAEGDEPGAVGGAGAGAVGGAGAGAVAVGGAGCAINLRRGK